MFRTLALSIMLFLFSVVSLIAGSVGLAWDASTSPNIAGYKVFVGSASRTYGPPITIGNQTTYTVSNLAPGVYFFAVSAFNTSGGESGYSNEVTTEIFAPLIITVTPAQLTGFTGQFLSATLAVTGGKPPYTYAVQSGTLPAGLTLNPSTGVLSGTPTQSGDFTVVISGTDSTNVSVNLSLALKILVAAPGNLRFVN